MEGNGTFCTAIGSEAGGIRHVHIVAYAVDRQEYRVDAAGQGSKNMGVIQGVTGDIVKLIFGLQQYADGIRVAVGGRNGRESEGYSAWYSPGYMYFRCNMHEKYMWNLYSFVGLH